MIERTIILPQYDNEGNSQSNEVDAILDEIIDISGGVSTSLVNGYWKDGFRLYHDVDNVRVTTTIDEETDKRLYAQLPGYCARLKQLALYTHKASVEVEFVECPVVVPAERLPHASPAA